MSTAVRDEVIARVVRALEALADDDVALAVAILTDLEADLVAAGDAR